MRVEGNNGLGTFTELMWKVVKGFGNLSRKKMAVKWQIVSIAMGRSNLKPSLLNKPALAALAACFSIIS